MKKKIAYLCSGYPGVSHTFIFREIMELRENGFELLTASVNKFQSWPKITKEEKTEAENTFYIKEKILKLGIIFSLIGLLLSPRKLLQSLLWTWRFVAFGGPKSFTKAIGYFLEAVILSHWLKENEISHLHIHFPNPAASVTLIAQKMHDFEFSLSVHGPDIFYNLKENLLAKKVAQAKFVRCISHYSRSQLMRIAPQEHWEKLHIVRCGVDPDIFRLRSRPANKVPQIFCVGRLVPAKGQHILLQACAKLIIEAGKNIALTFVGDGEDRESLEISASHLGIRERVIFTGSVGQKEIREYYQKADLFVLPSFAEGVPVVLMEAMAMGIPVISTNITGIPELIEDGENGSLVFASDVLGLAKKIELVLRKPIEQEVITGNARKTIETKYNLGKNCQLLTEIFTKELEL